MNKFSVCFVAGTPRLQLQTLHHHGKMGWLSMQLFTDTGNYGAKKVLEVFVV